MTKDNAVVGKALDTIVTTQTNCHLTLCDVE